MKNNKKGLEQVQALVWSLVMIGILLGIGILLLGKFHNVVYETSDAIAVTNGSVNTVVNATGSYLPIYTYRNVACSVNACINRTANVLIPANNWTTDNCKIIAVGAQTNLNQLWNCTYSYTYEPESVTTEALNDTINATGDIPGWLPIIVIIVIASVILFYVFVMRRQQGGA